jgi:hypothetical protein
MNLQNLEQYCEQLGVLVQVVPKGMQLIPPARSVEHLDHNPHLTAEQNRLEELWYHHADDEQNANGEEQHMHAEGVLLDEGIGSWD